MIRNIERDQEDHIHTHEAQKHICIQKLLYLYLDTKAMLANSTMLNYIHAIERDIKPNTLADTMVADVKKNLTSKDFMLIYIRINISHQQHFNYIKTFYILHFRWQRMIT